LPSLSRTIPRLPPATPRSPAHFSYPNPPLQVSGFHVSGFKFQVALPFPFTLTSKNFSVSRQSMECFRRNLDTDKRKNHIGHMIATLRESKTRLSELVQLASQGEEILITVRGKPSARLVAVGEADFPMGDWMRELSSLRASVMTSRLASNFTALDEVREDRW